MQLGIGIIGAGAVGCALARALKQSGYNLAVCIDKHLSPARDLANELDIPSYSSSLQDLGPDTAVLIIAVPDSQIQSVDRALSKVTQKSQLKLCAHTSGALPGSVLETVRAFGTPVGSIHPLQTFPSRARSPDLKGTCFTVEGDDRAVVLLEEIIDRVGGIPVKLSEDGKVLYHAAAVFSSNFWPVLQRKALELLSTVDIPPHLGRKLLAPLMRQSLENCLRLGEVEAITGPVVRGDAIIVERHLNAVHDVNPLTESLYRILSLMALELAAEKGLDREKLKSVQEALNR